MRAEDSRCGRQRDANSRRRVARRWKRDTATFAEGNDSPDPRRAQTHAGPEAGPEGDSRLGKQRAYNRLLPLSEHARCTSSRRLAGAASAASSGLSRAGAESSRLKPLLQKAVRWACGPTGYNPAVHGGRSGPCLHGRCRRRNRPESLRPHDRRVPRPSSASMAVRLWRDRRRFGATGAEGARSAHRSPRPFRRASKLSGKRTEGCSGDRDLSARHSREGGNPATFTSGHKSLDPAFAGMTA